MHRNEWLKSLKEGDDVLVEGSRMSNPAIRKIDRLTKTQFIIGKSRYRRRDGRRIGDDEWTFVYIKQADDMARARIGRLRAINFLNSFKFSDLSDKALKAIMKLVKDDQA
jgi:hypothetical protein